MRSRIRYLVDYKTSEHLTEEQRSSLGSFWTSPKIATKMAKKLKWKQGQILDPTCGGGSLFAACLDMYSELQEEDCFGIDIDSKAIELCKNYFPYGHFQVGDAIEDPIELDEWWKKDPFETWKQYKKRTNYKEPFKFGTI